MSATDLRVIYLQFTAAHQHTGLAKLKNLLSEFFPNAQRHFCVVDNAITGNFEVSLDSETDLVPGDNCSRDFSGYDLGVKWLQAAYPASSKTIWIFANDTFHRELGTETLKFFKKDIVDFGIRSKAFVGYQDSYPREIQIFGLPLQRWIRTHFFMLSDESLTQVLPLAMSFEDADIFGKNPKAFFKNPSPLSERYRNYLQTWLFGKKDPSGDFKAIWRSSEKLTSRNFDEFKSKTRAILSEHYLSARLQYKGIRVVPVNHGKLSIFLNEDKFEFKYQKLPNPKASSVVANRRRSLSS